MSVFRDCSLLFVLSYDCISTGHVYKKITLFIVCSVWTTLRWIYFSFGRTKQGVVNICILCLAKVGYVQVLQHCYFSYTGLAPKSQLSS